jgi:hypothetical protein
LSGARVGAFDVRHQNADAFCVREGQGAQQKAIQQAEDRGVYPDREGQRQDHGVGKTDGLAQLARGVAQILHQIFDQLRAACLTALLRDLFRSAQCKFRATHCQVQRSFHLAVFLRLTIQVILQLLIHLAVRGFATEE